MDTKITFRTDKHLKEEATKVFESLDMNLSTALNMFLRQTVIKQNYPCALETDVVRGNAITYKKDFFSLFGKGADLGLDEEPEDQIIVDDISL